MSIRKYFEEELNALKLALVKMCRTTEEMIDGAIHALIMQDTVLAKNVIEMDPDVDAMEVFMGECEKRELTWGEETEWCKQNLPLRIANTCRARKALDEASR